MAIMVAVVGALSAFMQEDFEPTNPKKREIAAIKLIAKMATLAAMAFRTFAVFPFRLSLYFSISLQFAK